MSTVDPSGTAPGLKKEEVSPKKFHVRCKNTNCDSILAIEISLGGQVGGAQRMYQCCKCKHTWGVAVGGYVGF